MKYKKGMLLFEVAFVVLLMSVISLFLFRGFAVFLKAGRKSGEYLKLSSLLEEKIWELEKLSANAGLSPENIELTGEFEQVPFKWSLAFQESGYSGLNKCVLKTEQQGERKSVFDAVMFFKTP